MGEMMGMAGMAPLNVSVMQTPHWSTANGAIAASHIAAWTPKGAASLAASYTQYGSLGTGLTVGVAPTWSAATGWTFNTTSQYLLTGITPTSGYSIICRFANANPANYKFLIGTVGSTVPRLVIWTVANTNQYAMGYGDSAYYYGSFVSSGVMAVTPTGAYVNGSSVKTWSPVPSFGANTNHIRISGRDSSSYWAGADIISCAVYDVDISAHAATITAAMQAL